MTLIELKKAVDAAIDKGHDLTEVFVTRGEKENKTVHSWVESAGITECGGVIFSLSEG